VDKPPPPSSETKPGAEPAPDERFARLSGAWTSVLFGLLVVLLVLVFILQNQQTVELSFLVFHGQLPLAVALLFAVILGALIVLALGGALIARLRRPVRRGQRQG
jgi:uncharacterized integral membrane protein